MEETKGELIEVSAETPACDDKQSTSASEPQFETIDYVRELFLHAVDQQKSDRKRLRLLRLCALMLVITTACFILFCVSLLPRLISVCDEATKTLQIVQTIDVDKLEKSVDGFITEAGDSLTKVGDAASVLNGIDIDTLNDAIKKLDTAAESLLGVDIASLNTAIKNLNDTVEPFAKFFGKLR